MDIRDIIRTDDLLLDVKANSIKRVFCDLSDHLADAHGIPQRALYNALNERERIGSTCVGEGVLLPHARLAKASKVKAVFARLCEPIDAGALDDKRVDLVVMVVAPMNDQSDHIKAISRITRILRDEQNRETLRLSSSRDEIYTVFTS